MISFPKLSLPAWVALVVSLLLLAPPRSCLVDASSPAFPLRRASTCNGSPDFCNRSYGNITFVGAHKFDEALNTDLAGTDPDVIQQLDDGIRMLQVQAGLDKQSGVIGVCHNFCGPIYDGGSLSVYLTLVKSWLDTNPSEVLSLLIVNIDDLPPTSYDNLFRAASLDTMSYIPHSESVPVTRWPTLGSLIDSGKRLVTFMDASADYTSVPYIIDELSNIWETRNNVVTTFDCSVDRTKGNSPTQMYLINHFFDTVVLDPNQINGVSGENSLGQQVSLCVGKYGRNPNFILVNFYEYGGDSVFQVAAAANGVAYSGTPTSPIATSTPQSSSTTGLSAQWTTASIVFTSLTFVALYLF